MSGFSFIFSDTGGSPHSVGHDGGDPAQLDPGGNEERPALNRTRRGQVRKLSVLFTAAFTAI